MLNTTLNLLRKAGACEKGYKKLAEHLGGALKYGKNTPIPLTVVLSSNGLDDTLWILRATIEPADALARDFAADCADSVRHLIDDDRSISAISVARRHARGQASDADLAAARNSAWAAARAAAMDAAWAAAWDADLAAAWAAAMDAAWAAAWAAARAAFAENFRARLLAHDPATNPLGEVVRGEHSGRTSGGRHVTE